MPAVAGVEIALHPVIGRAATVFGDGFEVFGLGPVQLGTGEQHGLDAMGLRAVRVFHGLAFGMVLAVHADPFLGDLSGGQPQPQAEKMRRNGM